MFSDMLAEEGVSSEGSKSSLKGLGSKKIQIFALRWNPAITDLAPSAQDDVEWLTGFEEGHSDIRAYG